ncbi:MAG: hypothetical protein P8I82_00710 [Flavobacteriales bacterium]|nr:hypothetical protein [Flavobacteriales bacterium]
MRKLLYIYLLGTFFLNFQATVLAQDIIHLKNGTVINCRITEISDFVLYAQINDGPELVTFFSDDVSHLVIGRRNEAMIWQLKQGVEDAMEFSNLSIDSTGDGYYFGFTYDSITNYNKSKKHYQTDSLGNPILVPYNPIKTPFPDRLKSLIKSLVGKQGDDVEKE